jgi:hypothetical protein
VVRQRRAGAGRMPRSLTKAKPKPKRRDDKATSNTARSSPYPAYPQRGVRGKQGTIGPWPSAAAGTRRSRQADAHSGVLSDSGWWWVRCGCAQTAAGAAALQSAAGWPKPTPALPHPRLPFQSDWRHIKEIDSHSTSND